MKKYFLYLCPNSIFFVTLSVGIFKRGQVDLLFDGSFLLVFILSHLSSHKSHYLLASACALGVFFYPDNLLEILSLGLSSGLSGYGFGSLKQLEEDHNKQKMLAVFFETMTRKNIDQIATLQDKLDTFLMQEIQDIACVEELLPLKSQPYDEMLDSIEERMASSQDVKEKKQPLRRLRRIVMKQTSFFDESDNH